MHGQEPSPGREGHPGITQGRGGVSAAGADRVTRLSRIGFNPKGEMWTTKYLTAWCFTAQQLYINCDGVLGTLTNFFIQLPWSA